MASVFTRIIAGELPGRFVYRDPDVVAFLTIAPLRPGHTLVVPTAEVEDWLAMPPDLAARTFAVARTIGAAVQAAFRPRRVALLAVGLEVPHAHLHVVGIDAESDIDFAHVDTTPDPAGLDAAAAALRTALGPLGAQ